METFDQVKPTILRDFNRGAMLANMVENLDEQGFKLYVLALPVSQRQKARDMAELHLQLRKKEGV